MESRYSWVERTVADYRQNGWETLIAEFEAEEPDPVPEWMKDRIRATDIEQFIDLCQSYPDWNWEEWDALPGIDAPTLFVTGELEDPDDAVSQIVAEMRNGEVLRLNGLGHINAFLASDAVLERVTPFLAEHAPRS